MATRFVHASRRADGLSLSFTTDGSTSVATELAIGGRTVLYRYDGFCDAGTAWSVKLYDESGADALEGLMAGLAVGSGVSGDLTGEIDTGLGARRIVIGPGRYMVEVTTDAAASGAAVIYWSQ